MKEHTGSVVSGMLFVAGTSVGAGMLALPFATGLAGFWPAVAITVASWAFMLCTGLLFLEATLWMPDGANVLSMTRRFLGVPGRIVGGLSFLFLYYCLLIAYFSGGSPIFTEAIKQIFGLELGPQEGLALFSLIFALVIWMGAWVTDKLNFVLMAAMIIAYIGLIGSGVGGVKSELLQHRNWATSLLAVPTVWAAFGYHNIVPSISTYLKRDVRKLVLAITLGTLIPLIVYLMWQWVIMGTLSVEVIGETIDRGEAITAPLKNPWLESFTRYFAFFAITTSILGVALSMVDFLGDGTKIPRKGWGRFALVLLVFTPPFAFTWISPHLFFRAFHYAGVFGEAILNGLIPILMVWVGRYRLKLDSPFRLPGGRWLLTLLLAATLYIVISASLT